MKKIVIDPVTRIEGHLRVEVEVDKNSIIKEAYVSGQLFRGIEMILKDRDPRDAGLLAGRICGVCTNSHFNAAVSAVENAYKLEIPRNALIIRNLVSMALFLQDHVIHFYHLHLMDYVDVSKALKADEEKAFIIAKKYSKTPYNNSLENYKLKKEKLQKLVNNKKLGPFSSSYYGHKTYKLNPEENLILISNYFEALKFQTDISKAIAIFGGKTPHPQSFVVGGISSVVDMLNVQRLNDYIFVLKRAKEFIDNAYIPDMKLIASVYKGELKLGLGKSCGNYFAVGGYEMKDGKTLFQSGVIYEFDFENIQNFEESKITEETDRAWYKDDKIFYTDLNEDSTLKTRKKDDKYSWIKAPRYDDKPMECGPVARILISYLKNNESLKPFVDEFLNELDISLKDLGSSIGRNICRAIESAYVAENIFKYINELIQNIQYYNTDTCVSYNFDSTNKNANGRAFFEVPRGVLYHDINIKNGKIENYRVIAPTTWNASPKDLKEQRGPYEQALIGIKIEDTSKPLEVLRVLHSFDPCISCAVHVMNLKGKKISKNKI